ncbi:cytoplasmic protein [Mycena sp. CBHHK59/15]|nr:cytoplasmic protein [Mycena sp. CBHHK59/15]
MPSDSPTPRDSASPPQSRSPSPVAHDTLTLRALVSTKDAGVIIGKAGKNVADLREQTGVKAGVSKVIQGVHERVLTVTGPVEGVAKVRTHRVSSRAPARLHAHYFPTRGHKPDLPHNLLPSSVHTSIRLLISHNLMGTIIGRNGLKIKAIQDGSGTRMVASKDMLPQSTERIVEVQGAPDAIGHAIEEIGKCLLEDWERGLGTVLFHPGTGDDRSANRRSSVNGLPGSYGAPRRTNGDARGRASPPGSPPMPQSPVLSQPPANLRTQNISIPSDMVGCIIGRSGTKITEIRRLSGSKISIAKAPHDETGERMFTIIGTPDANEKALFLLYNQLESEKERRVNKETHQQQQEMQE